MPQVESCRLITGRRVPANPLEVRASPIVIDSSQSRPFTRITCENSSCIPRSKVRPLRRPESVSAVQPHNQKTFDLSVVTGVSGLCDLSVPSVHRTPVHLALAFIGGAGHPRAALRAGAPARDGSPARTTWHTTTGTPRRPPGCRGQDVVLRPRGGDQGRSLQESRTNPVYLFGADVT